MSGPKNPGPTEPASPGNPTRPGARRPDDSSDEPKSPGPPAHEETPSPDSPDEPKSPGPPPGSIPGESA